MIKALYLTQHQKDILRDKIEKVRCEIAFLEGQASVLSTTIAEDTNHD